VRKLLHVIVLSVAVFACASSQPFNATDLQPLLQGGHLQQGNNNIHKLDNAHTLALKITGKQHQWVIVDPSGAESPAFERKRGKKCYECDCDTDGAPDCALSPGHCVQVECPDDIDREILRLLL